MNNPTQQSLNFCFTVNESINFKFRFGLRQKFILLEEKYWMSPLGILLKILKIFYEFGHNIA